MIGGVTGEGTNELTALKTVGGRLYLNSRNYRLHEYDECSGHYRSVSWSLDGGDTFVPVVHDAGLPEPGCQASVCRLTGDGRICVLLSNPTGVVDGTRQRREMTV